MPRQNSTGPPSQLARVPGPPPNPQHVGDCVVNQSAFCESRGCIALPSYAQQQSLHATL